MGSEEGEATNQCGILSRLNSEINPLQHRLSRACGVSKMHVAEFDQALDSILETLAAFGPCIDGRLTVKQLLELGRCALGLGHIGRGRKDGASSVGAKKNLGEAHVELKDGVFVLTEEHAAVPKGEGGTETLRCKSVSTTDLNRRT